MAIRGKSTYPPRGTIYRPPTKDKPVVASDPIYDYTEICSIATECSIPRLQEKMIEGRFVLRNIVDKENNTLLHIVIQTDNPTISELEKLEMLRWLIDNGCFVNAKNNKNITPLHLASELQLRLIIELLLENKADPDVIDISGSTPLHYVVKGKSVACPTIESPEVKELISQPHTNTIDTEKELQKITIPLSEHMQKDPDFQIYMNHYFDTIKTFDKRYQNEYDELISTKKDTIISLLSDTTKTKIEQKAFITKEIANLKSIVYEKLISNKLKNTLKPIKLNLNNLGWGTIEGEEFKIFPKPTPKEELEILMNGPTGLKVELTKELDDMNNLIRLIDTKIELEDTKKSSLRQCLNDMQRNIYMIFYLNENLRLNGTFAGNSLYDIPNTIINKNKFVRLSTNAEETEILNKYPYQNAISSDKLSQLLSHDNDVNIITREITLPIPVECTENSEISDNKKYAEIVINNMYEQIKQFYVEKKVDTKKEGIILTLDYLNSELSIFEKKESDKITQYDVIHTPPKLNLTYNFASRLDTLYNNIHTHFLKIKLWIDQFKILFK